MHALHNDTALTPEQVMREAWGEIDWANRPTPTKRYRGVRPQDLPLDFPASKVAAADALTCGGPPSDEPIDLGELTRLLFFTAGATRQRSHGNETMHFRAAPSAGALYPIEAYVVCGGLAELDAGVYHFEPVELALQPLRAGDWREALSRAVVDESVARAPVSLVLTGIPWRTTWKYGARGYRHLFWDAGVVIANLLAVARGDGLDPTVLTGFSDHDVARLIGVAAHQAPGSGGEMPLAVVSLGTTTEAAPPSGHPPDLELAAHALSDEVTNYPSIWAAHREGDLLPSEVDRWRQAMTVPTRAPALPAGSLAAEHESLDQVILRRGSTRRFADEPVHQGALAWPLAVAGQDVPGDWSPTSTSLLTNFVLVHDVTGVEPGAYRLAWDGPARLRRGDVRDDARFLCLGQRLAGDSAYTVVHTTELEPLLAAGGARAYRVAQLEAGIAAGRLQLAAFTLGVGASGVTFFDHEVSRFLGTVGSPLLAVAVGRPGYEPRPGQRPGPVP